MGFMTIDGQRVEFTNEPNVLTVIRNAEIDIRPFVTIPNCPFTVPAVCAP